MTMTVRSQGATPARKPRSRPNLSPDQARELVAEWVRSGESLRAFARRKGVSANGLAYWRTQFAPPPAPAAPPAVPPFLPVTRASPPTPPAAAPRAVFEVTLGAGHALRIPADFDAAALARLVATLREVDAW